MRYFCRRATGESAPTEACRRCRISGSPSCASCGTPCNYEGSNISGAYVPDEDVVDDSWLDCFLFLLNLGLSFELFSDIVIHI